MSVKVEKTDNKNELKLEFTIESSIFEEGIKKVYQKSARYFNIPGFRKGKAPLARVEKVYGSQIFYEDAFNEVVPEIFDKEVKENNLEVVSRPEISIVQMEKGKDLLFTAIVQTKPDVKLGKYKGVEIKKIEHKVTAEDVNHEWKHMAEKNVRVVTVEDRAVKDGDLTTIDFVGTVDGVEFDGGKAENYELEIGSHSFIAGFEDQIIGMKKDDVKDINVTFPEDYFTKDLAGKPAVFKVTLHEIKEKQYPEMDDEFAKDVSEFDTMDELKKDIKKKLKEENDHRAKHETENAAVEAVVKDAKVDIPSGMIEMEIDNMENDMNQRLQYQGLNLEQYLKFLNKSREDFRGEMKEQAETTVKTRLVLEAVAKDAKIEALDEEIKDRVSEMAKSYGRPEDELMKNEEFKKYVADSIVAEKTVICLVENAEIK